MRKVFFYFGILLCLLSCCGYGYIYLEDHREAASLSAYCRIDFQSSLDEMGRIEGATLSLVDYRYGSGRPKDVVTILTDGNNWDIDAVTRQTAPTYSLSPYDPDTSFKNMDKFFVEVPFWLLPEIRNAREVRVRFGYDDGTTIDLPLDAHDLAYWQNVLYEGKQKK